MPNGTNFTVTMRIDAHNSGDVTLKDVQVTDDLDSTFSGVQSFTVTSKSATGLTLNTNYNGTSDINLLVGTNTLAVGATGSVFRLSVWSRVPERLSTTLLRTHEHRLMARGNWLQRTGIHPAEPGSGTVYRITTLTAW